MASAVKKYVEMPVYKNGIKNPVTIAITGLYMIFSHTADSKTRQENFI